MFPYQGVCVVAGEDEYVDGRGVVGDADAVLGHVLGVVVSYHSRYGASQDLIERSTDSA